MGKLKLDLDVDDNNDELKINKSYAKNYEKWRSKEVLQQLKDKYKGKIPSEDEEVSPSESEPEWTADDEKSFFRTLGALKSNDPTIYDKTILFFKEKEDGADIEESSKKKKKEKTKPEMTLRDYEIALVTEKEGKFDDEDDVKFKEDDPKPEGYYEKSAKIKEEIKKAAKLFDDDDEDDNDDGFLKKREKTKVEIENEEEDFREWLKGEGKNLSLDPNDGIVKLKKQWENADENEAFLKDYLLNKKYEVGSDDEVDDGYDDMLEIEQEFDKADEFERKFNFRFEQQDQEFIKQYPRTVKESVRKTDDSRKQKREERKKRKEMEKQKEKDEIKMLKSLKKKEIEDKLKKLRDIIGDDSIPITLDDLEKDFDPKEYDEKMKQAFSENYYDNCEDEEKPEFSEMSGDEEELSDYDNIPIGTLKNNDDEEVEENDDEEAEDHEEGATRKEKDKKRRNKRNEKFKELIAKKKPVFNPDKKSFDEYLKEYYDLDYEDILPGNVRTKFHYCDVPANDFGLTTEEILAADDKQLNQWVSVKKATQKRTLKEEEYDKKAYKIKAKNRKLKEKIFSRKRDLDEEIKRETKAKKNLNNKQNDKKSEDKNEKSEEVATINQMNSKKKNRRKNKKNNQQGQHQKKKSAVVEKFGVDMDRLQAYNISKTTIKRKIYSGTGNQAKKQKFNE